MAKKRAPKIESESEVVFAATEPTPAAAATPAVQAESTPAPTPSEASTEPSTGAGSHDDGTGFTLLNDGQKLKHIVFDESTGAGIDVTDGTAHGHLHEGLPPHQPPAPQSDLLLPQARREYGDRLAHVTTTTTTTRRDVDVSPVAMRREIDELGRPSGELSEYPTNLKPWRRTLYRSTGGSEVRRYESSLGTSQLLTTRRDGDMMREERFHSRLVEPIIGVNDDVVNIVAAIVRWRLEIR